MSKYIIELDDRIKLVTSVGVTENGVVYTTSDYVHNLEELNSDYINEHYGELQDEAYQKGFEDGKKSIDLGCEDCKYHEDISLTNPCNACTRAWKDHYTPAPHSDRIEVGDEVINDSGTKFTVTGFANSNNACGISARGFWCFNIIEKLTKTGKHYDIQSILEAMRT